MNNEQPEWYDEFTALLGKALGMMGDKPCIDHHKVVKKVKELIAEENKRCASVASKLCSGTHRGTGEPDCPKTEHHHHDEKCMLGQQLAQAIRNIK